MPVLDGFLPVADSPSVLFSSPCDMLCPVGNPRSAWVSRRQFDIVLIRLSRFSELSFSSPYFLCVSVHFISGMKSVPGKFGQSFFFKLCRQLLFENEDPMEFQKKMRKNRIYFTIYFLFNHFFCVKVLLIWRGRWILYKY